jgi:hypothetical protein
VGIGVAGGTSRALTAACDEYADYDALLATDAAVRDDEVEAAPRASEQKASSSRAAAAAEAEPVAEAAPEAAAPPARRRRASSKTVTDAASAEAVPEAAASTEAAPTKASSKAVQFVAPVEPGAADEGATGTPRNPGRLLLKALELMRAKNDQEWQTPSAVKNQMLRMDPSFQERRLGFATFTDFLKSRGGVVELDESAQNRVRIRPKKG